MKTMFRRRWYFFVPLILVAIIGFSFLAMVLWNALLPQLFHFPQITFWQTVGLLILFRLLLGGFRGHHGRCGHHHWRNNIHEKLEKMSPEEREKFYKNLHYHRHSWGCMHDDDKKNEKTEDKNA